MKRAPLIRALCLTTLVCGSSVFAQTIVTWGGNAPSGAPAGGAGTWNSTNLNWTANNGSTYQAWTSAGTDPAVFSGTGGLVTLGSGLQASAMTFGADGYVIGTNGGSTLTLVNNAFGFGPRIEVTNPGQTVTIAAPLAGAVGTSGLYVAGRGTLVLSGPTTFSSSINITSATLKVMSATSSLQIQNLSLGSTPSAPTGGGGTFILDNTGATGATLTQLGAIIFAGGDANVQVNRVAAQDVALQFVNQYARVAGASGNFSTSGGTNGTQVKIITNVSGFLDQGAFFNGSSYAYGDSGGFLRGINYGSDTGAIASTGGTSVAATTHLKLTGNVTNQATAAFTTINLAGANTLTIGSANTVTLSGLLKTGGNAATITGGTIRPTNSTAGRDLVIRTDLATDALTISSLINNSTAGSATLTKTGAGTLTLTNTANAYTGGTYLNAGTLSVASLPTGTAASTIGTGALRFSGGTLQYTGPTASTTRTINVNPGGGTIEVTNAGTTLTLNSAIPGGNNAAYEDSLVKAGPGTLALTGSNDNGGLTTVVNAGTLSLAKTSTGSRHATGNLWINSGGTAQLNGSGGDQIYDGGHVVVASGGVLDFNGKTESFDGLSGAGSVTNTSTSANSTMTFGISSAATTAGSTFSGIISDGASKTMAVVKAGTATQILTGANTYTGGTTISGGTLQIGAGGTTGSIAGAVSIADQATFAFNRSDNVTFSGAISGAGNLTQLGSGNLTLSGSVSNTGAVTIANGTLTPGSSTTLQNNTVTLSGGGLAFGALTSATLGGLAGTGIVTNNLSGASGLTVGNNGANTTFSGTLTGSGALTKTGAGALTLSGTANYTGTTYLNDGMLAFGSAAAIPTASNIRLSGGVIGVGTGAPTSYTTGSGSGQLNFVGDGGFAALGGNRSITLNGGATLAWGSGGFVGDNSALILSHANSTATTTFTNNLDLSGSDRHVRVADGSAAVDATLSGNLIGSGGFVKEGAGTLTLTGTNTYSGATTIQEGLIEFSTLGNFGNSSSITLDGGGLRYATGNTTDLTAGGRPVTFTYFGGTIDTNGNNVTWNNGVQTTDGWLTKMGAGSLTINRPGNGPNNTIAGVHVDNGTLTLNNFTGTGSLFVGTASGQTGTLNLNNSTWSSDGDLLIGHVTGGAGVVTISNSTLSGGAFGVQVGESGSGTLTVQNGSSITAPFSFTVGSGADGTATVDNSSVSTSSWLQVGYGSGTHGTLTVQNGGIVSTSDTVSGATVGYYQSSGSLVVTGKNSNNTPSQFISAGPMDIGGYGYGSMTVSAGGVVTGGVANIGGTGSGSGDVTVTGTGSAWNINAGSGTTYALSVGSAITSSLTVADGGVVNFTGTNKVVSIAPVGTLKIGNGALAGTLGATTIANLGVLAFNHADAVTFGANITGSGTLTKAGAGTLTLSGSNDYSGTTTVSGGTLSFGSNNAIGTGTLALTGGSVQADGTTARTLGNAVTFTGTGSAIGGSANLTLGTLTNVQAGNPTLTINNTGTTTFGGLNLSNSSTGRTVTFAGNGNLAISGVVANRASGTSAAGNLIKTGTGVLTLNGANTYTGTTTVSAGTLSTNKILVSSSNSGLGNATSAITLGSASTAGTLSYTGNTTNYTRGLTLNAGGGGFDVATAGQTVTFTTAGVTAGGLFTVSGAGNTTIGTAVSGTGGLAKTGTGTLTLSGTNTYAGGTTVSNGTLLLSSTGTLNTSGALTAAGGTLDLGGIARSVGGVTFSGGTVQNGTLTGSAYDAQSGTIAASAILAGSNVALTKTGSGTLTIAGNANTYTGATAINNGTVVFSALGGLGNGTAINFGGSGGTLRYASGNTADISARTVTFSAVATIDTNGNNVTFANGVGNNGTGGLTKVGAGTLTLAGSNTYSGATTVSEGTVQFAKAAALPANPTASTFVVNSGASAVFNVGGAGEFTASNIDAVIQLGSASGGFKSGSFIGFDTTNAGPGGFTYGSAINDPNGNALGLLKLGSGTLTLAGANLYSGDTYVNSGTLTIGVANALSPNTHLHVATGASFNPYVPAGPTTTTVSDLTGGGNVNLGGSGSTLEVQTGSGVTNTFQGALTGSGGLTLNGSNTGTLVLAPAGGASNNYTGPTTITSGTVQLGANGALPSTTQVQLGNSGTLDVHGTTTTIGQLGGSGTVNLGTGPGNAGALTIDQGSTSTFSGSVTGTGNLNLGGSGALTLSGNNDFTGNLNLTGSGSVTLSGTNNFVGDLNLSGGGTVTVTGANTFTGNTMVSSGTLVVNNGTTGSATGTGTVTIGAGGTLAGSGTISGNATIGGVLAPGNSPGTLNFGGSLTLQNTTVVQIQIGGYTGNPVNDRGVLFDAVNVHDLLTFGNATLTVILINGFNPSTGQSYNIFDFGSDSGTFGTINLPSLASGLSWDTSSLYLDGSLSITGTGAAIPEPSTYAALAGLGVLFVAWQRRRRAA